MFRNISWHFPFQQRAGAEIITVKPVLTSTAPPQSGSAFTSPGRWGSPVIAIKHVPVYSKKGQEWKVYLYFRDTNRFFSAACYAIGSGKAGSSVFQRGKKKPHHLWLSGSNWAQLNRSSSTTIWWLQYPAESWLVFSNSFLSKQMSLSQYLSALPCPAASRVERLKTGLVLCPELFLEVGSLSSYSLPESCMLLVYTFFYCLEEW